ncbi:MAG TPA: DUF3106 domain-containing protein [Verrucomicrobiae bacterium]|jgi:hypothetical protein
MRRFFPYFLTATTCWGVFAFDATAEQTNAVFASYQSVSPAITLRHISPVEYFRGLLGMTAEQRERALATRTPAERRAILEKVREYEALPRQVREARLRQTDLHWHLIMLMRMDPKQRVEHFKLISPLDMPMVIGQLQQWDELPEATRKALLANAQFMETYVAWQVSSPADQKEILNKMPVSRRAEFTEELKRWQALPESRQAELSGQFQRFFVMTGQEQQQTISALSDADRRDMEEALEAYQALPPEQRQRCIDSFGKFATMSPEERAQFLMNAAKWDAMTLMERQLWRSLVGKLPPMPPAPLGFPPMPAGFPPMPPSFPAPGNSSTAMAR